MPTYFILIKNPPKTRRGITIGTTSAAAASGVGAATPINDPKRQNIFVIEQIFSTPFNLPTESATVEHKIRMPCKIKYL